MLFGVLKNNLLMPVLQILKFFLDLFAMFRVVGHKYLIAPSGRWGHQRCRPYPLASLRSRLALRATQHFLIVSGRCGRQLAPRKITPERRRAFLAADVVASSRAGGCHFFQCLISANLA
jgi:hypothetical protein